jgi:hypothetical protein
MAIYQNQEHEQTVAPRVDNASVGGIHFFGIAFGNATARSAD